MEILFKSVAGVLVSVVLYHTIPSERKELALLLSIAVSCMVCVTAVTYISPVMDFLEQLQYIGNLDSQMLKILVQAVGIGFVSEIASLICKDFGNGALGHGLQFLAISFTLWLALPLLQQLLVLMQTILLSK